MKRAVVYQHERHEWLGLFEPALKAAGFTLTRRFREASHEDVNADLLVVLGGGMGVYESAQHPFLGAEIAVLTERLANGAPCLGICLGAQLMAAALGAQVAPGKNGAEVGAAKVRFTAAGLADPVLRGVPPELVVAHWHGDTWSPLPDAVLLASTSRYAQQAFRYGNSFAFQFHPELTADELGRWLDSNPANVPHDARASLGKLRAREADLVALTQRLADHFARSSATTR